MTSSTPRAIGRHIAFVGFMGAGKTTIGREVARLTERPFVDTDDMIERRHGVIGDVFDEHGEQMFRQLEEAVVEEVLARAEPCVVALGGGAVLSRTARTRLRERAYTLWIHVDEKLAWSRCRASDRPLARDRDAFRRLLSERTPVYRDVADNEVSYGNADDALCAALNVFVARDILSPPRLDERVSIVADVNAVEPNVFELYANVVSTHSVPGGEETKRLETAARLWHELDLERGDRLVAFGGGCTTDLVGFVAATYLRGIRWRAVPTTLVGQVDAAIGGKTGINLERGKNLVGAFHFPETVTIDVEVLHSLPGDERRQGMAEVVKTGLLAGRPLWELPEEEMIRACAAFKCAVVLSDPYEEGRRAILNLGHTFAHALEAASDYTLRHGDAVALGLLAALRLSGQPTDVVEGVLDPRPVRVARERAWTALKRDKKAAGGRTRLVLLPEPGRPAYGVELPDEEVRTELDRLIRD